MIAVDTVRHRLIRNAQIKEELAKQQPYGDWVKENLIKLQDHAKPAFPPPADPLDILSITQRQLTFGYSSEEVEMVAQADGRHRRRSRRLDGRRHAARGPLACSRACSTRTSSSSSRRSPIRRSTRSARSSSCRSTSRSAGSATCSTKRPSTRASSSRTRRSSSATRWRRCVHWRRSIIPPSRSIAPGTPPMARKASSARSTASAPRPRAAVAAGARIVILTDREIERDPRAGADAARHRRGASSPHPRRAAHEGEPHLRDGRSARHPPGRLPHRLRRERGASVPAARVAARVHRHGPGRRGEGPEESRRRSREARESRGRDEGRGRDHHRSRQQIRAQGAGGRPAQDHVQDGHLGPRVSYHGAQIFEAIGIGESVIDEVLRPARRRRSAASASSRSRASRSRATRRPSPRCPRR